MSQAEIIDFGEKLKDARVRQGMTQPQASEAAGVSLRMWKYWESGTMLPSLPNAVKVLKVVGGELSIEWGEEEEPEDEDEDEDWRA